MTSPALDQFRAELLDAAQHRRPQPASQHLHPTRARRPRRARRGLAIALAALVVAVPALAVTRPWSPVLGRPDVDGRSPSASSAPVISDARKVLAILRRPQTAHDREVARPLLRMLSPQTDQVQTSSIRALAPGVALIPIGALRLSPGHPERDQLCVVSKAMIGCNPASLASTQGVGYRLGGPAGTRLIGVVPDWVARVRFTPKGGAPAEVSVASNFYRISVPQFQRGWRVPPPPGSGRRPSRLPPQPANGVVQWLDVHGAAVGPKRQSPQAP